MSLNIQGEIIVDFDVEVNEILEKMIRLRDTYHAIENKDVINSLFDVLENEKEREELREMLRNNLINEIVYLAKHVVDIYKEVKSREEI